MEAVAQTRVELAVFVVVGGQEFLQEVAGGV
jgi:hypothetical protein